ncbi:MAG: hydantoinase B/oxoprolinase family protein [Promethearchaeota archaeon]|jgi:N-methylhydantoinase B
MSDYDPITLGILWDKLISIVDEAFSVLTHISFSTVLRETFDCSCTILDAKGRSLAEATNAVPSFLGTMKYTIQHFLEKFPPSDLMPRDVITTTDPWIGTGHLYDINMAMPIFHEDDLIAYVGIIAHLPDMGGSRLGGSSREVYEEGLRIPVSKLVENGEINELIIDFLKFNVRTPEQVIADIKSEIATAIYCENRLIETIEKFQIEDFSHLADEIIGRSESIMRRAISKIPGGEYRFLNHVDGFESPVRIECCMKIEEDHVKVDYVGTDPQVDRGINCPLNYTRAFTHLGVKSVTVPDLPNNTGFVNPISVHAPEGTILNPQPPCATGARARIGHHLPQFIWGALAEVMPDMVVAEHGMHNSVNLAGRHRDSTPFGILLMSEGGFGARPQDDGPHTTAAPTNLSPAPIEVVEGDTSLFIVHKKLIPDSGGAGRFRGGCGQEIWVRNTTGNRLHTGVMVTRGTIPAKGYRGGLSGSRREILINGEPAHPFERYMLEPEAEIVIRDAGGGGFGQPKERAIENVVEDVRNGFVTVKAARDLYGVEIDTSIWSARRSF